MKLEKIVTMANRAVQWQLIGMVRSLRATGCQLPVLVIPHDRDPEYFELPEGCTWWRDQELHDWLMANGAHSRAGKYQCLMIENYHFVDCDVAFIENPEEALLPYQGFIATCNHWHDFDHTCTAESRMFFERKSTTWQRYSFNSGQFACDQILYSFEQLKNKLKEQGISGTALDGRFHEQAGMNLLVLVSGVQMQNLTLPPTCMESTWAGDYEHNQTVHYESFWKEPSRKPYLIHYAGCALNRNIAINELFFKHYSNEERQEVQNELDRYIANTLHHRTPRWRRLLSHLRSGYHQIYGK